jgi:hypothetical protein
MMMTMTMTTTMTMTMTITLSEERTGGFFRRRDPAPEETRSGSRVDESAFAGAVCAELREAFLQSDGAENRKGRRPMPRVIARRHEDRGDARDLAEHWPAVSCYAGPC